jgi:hypothetical protein
MEPRLNSPFVRPDVRLFLDYLNALPGPRTYEVGAVEARRMILASRFVADAPTGELGLIRDLSCPGAAGDIKLRLFDARAERGEAGPLLVYFHGGGFVFGDLDTHEPICAELARRLDMPVLSVDYRSSGRDNRFFTRPPRKVILVSLAPTSSCMSCAMRERSFSIACCCSRRWSFRCILRVVP